jgi:hypothetical protein
MRDLRQQYEYKGNQCAHCGRSVIEMMERYQTVKRMFSLHHVDPAMKAPDYDNLIQRVISTKQLDELDKCVLLCDFCHEIVEAQDITGTVLLKIAIGEKTAEQRLNGNVFVDSIDKTSTFVTNERVLLHPYHVQIGNADPQILFGTELETGGLMKQMMREIAKNKTVSIHSWNGALMLRVDHVAGKEVTMEQNIAFPVMQLELCKDEDNDIFLWVRNGVGLTRDGNIAHAGIIRSRAQTTI